MFRVGVPGAAVSDNIIEVEDLSESTCDTCGDDGTGDMLAPIDGGWICFTCLIAEVTLARDQYGFYLERLTDDCARAAMQALAPTVPDAQELAVRAYEIAAAMRDEREGGE
jgi:hypothetical protein